MRDLNGHDLSATSFYSFALVDCIVFILILQFIDSVLEQH